MSGSISRRESIRRLTACGLGVWAATQGSSLFASANDKLNIALVGCGGRGGENLPGVAGENIVALCDVDERQAGKTFEQFPQAPRFRDYRKLLDQMHAQIDAVVVSTPDHMHAPISLAAMELGKHVYCEKPLTWSIGEARQMAQAAAKYRVATQMGTQGMAEDAARAGIEVIRSGVLGKVTQLHVWTDRAKGWWPQGVDRPAGSPPVPAQLDWNLWLGVAPSRPYHPDYVPFAWRGWKDFGTGTIGDMAIHNAAMPYVGLQLGLPIAAEILDSSPLKSDTFPEWSKLRIDFPAGPQHGPVSMYWYDGGLKPSADLLFGQEPADNGAIIVGSAATLYSIEWTGGDWHLLPTDTFRDYQRPAATLPRAPGQDHYQDWLTACRGGTPAFCRFDGFAAQLTEVMLLGDLALRTGKNIRWDAEAMQAVDCPEAEPYIRRPYRTGW